MATRRCITLFVPLALFALLLTPPAMAAERPNILFCIADDASYPHMSAYGCEWISTPAFDRVADQGVLFTNAYTPNAKCAPSRACILTGRNSWQLEAAGNHMPFFPAKFQTYVEALDQHGYFVGSTAKGWSPGDPGEIDGVRRQLVGKPFNDKKAKPPANGISSNDYASNFEDFLAARSDDQPFCFWYGSTEPHRRYEFGSGITKGGRTPADITKVPDFWPDNETVRTDMLDYAFEIEHFDAHLGRMLETLEKAGELDNTLVLVTADNGMPFPRIKGQEYEYSNHLPLAVMWKDGIENPGRTVDDYVCFIDFAPTYLELAGVERTTTDMEPIQGRSLTDIFSSPKSGRVNPQRDHVVIGKERHDLGRPHDQGYPIRGIVKNGYLYLHNYETSRWPGGNPETGYMNCDGSPTKTVILESRTDPTSPPFWQQSFGKRPADEMFQINKDPECMTNLAANPEYAQLKKELREQLLAELKQQEDPRMFGQGHIFDEYPSFQDNMRGYYEKYLEGKAPRAGWINPTDIEDGPLD